MIQLMRYFKILFLSAQISREVLKSFAEDHIQRLTANNPGGIFTTILTSVTNAYNAYFGDYSSELLNLAVQEGKTLAMKESRTALLQQLSDNEKLVAYTYRKNKEIYEEFYPLGLTEYNEADLSALETKGERYKSVLAIHAADFTPTFVSDYTAVLQTFVDNRGAQVTAKSLVDDERSDLAGTRISLATELTRNLLTISLQYLGNESKAPVYFDQSIIDEAFRKSERKVEADIDPGDTQLVFDNITIPTLSLRLINKGDESINIGFVETPETVVTAGYLLKQGEDSMLKSAELGWTSEKKYLNVTNPGGITISYIIEKV